ncbi:MAG TPA: hypothetical protein VIQ05_05390 [Tardiphaga sp.]
MPSAISIDFINRSIDSDNSHVVLFEAAPGQPPLHTLRFHNNSGRTQTFVCYQAPGRDPNGHALAWFAMPIASGVEVNFRWREAYDLAWLETGLLAPGVQYAASQVVPATAGNSITLTGADGAFSFTGQKFAGPANELIVSCDGTIPINTLGVGIGMSGSPIMVIQAMPNITSVFMPLPEYWVTVADVTQGEVMDLSQLAAKAQVAFPPNVTAMTATLKPDQTWSIQQGLVV